MRFTIFQESRKGSRKVNQDRIAYTYGRDTLLMCVADGMGGHAGGEIAAQIAVRLFIERFQQEAKPILKNPLKFLQDTMLRAHAALGSYANQFSMLETPRTTCVACVVQANHAYWAHVGDSRFYLFRQGGLIGNTKDHSKVQYLVDQGIIAADEVSDHPDRNKIFSCLGGAAEPVIDLSKRTPLMNGDILILCTDGLWSVYPMREMFLRIADARGFWGYFLPLDLTLSTSAIFELLEWAAAELFGGDLGIAYLGTQGDPWDAHKDMALAGLGALLAMTATLLVNRRWQRDFNREWAESLRVKHPGPLGEVALGRMVRAEGFEPPTPAV